MKSLLNREPRSLPRQTDDPETRDAPTDSELNPLLNPLLADNMGRWAEVYFTSPPEKREDAVRQLVRELRDQHALGESVGAPASPETPPFEAAPPAPDREMAEGQSIEDRSNEHQSSDGRSADDYRTEDQPTEDRRICASCGRDNPMSHTFCGMCGARMEAPAAAEEIRQPDPVKAATLPGTTPAVISPRVERSSETPRPSTPKSPSFGAEPNAASGKRSSRIYLALVLLAVAFTGTILTLAHRAQRPPQTATTPGKAVVPIPVPAAKPAAAAANPVENSRTTPASSPVSKPTPLKPATSKPTPSKVRPEKPSAATPVKPPVEKIAPAPAPPPVAGNGSEELAVALGFLSGTGGHPRDRAQAMEWLWKAVGKQNTEAMLLLTDEYLRGEGTPKNFDQARVLLDAAAKRGIKEAADRLRHIQSYGCQ